MTVNLTANFLSNARGLTLSDGGGITWSINHNTNAISAAVSGGGGGGLTSVGLADASSTPIYTVSGSPLVSNGTISITLTTQTQKTFLAGPTSGSAAQPTFRTIAVADVPTLNQNTTGSSGSCTGNAATATAATSATTATNIAGGGAGSLPYQTGAGATGMLAAGSTGNLLTIAAGVPAWEAVPTWNQNTSGTAAGLSVTLAIGSGGTGQVTAAAAYAALSPLTTAGDIVYEDATPKPVRLAIGSSGKVLYVSGGVPVWQALAYTDISGLATAAHTGAYSDLTGTPSIPAAANPATAKVGLTTVNGSATTFMRSDAAPPLDQSIAPTWTGAHIFNAAVTLAAGTSSLAALTLPTGALLTSAAAGVAEYDGVAAYFTNETTAGRGLIPVEQYFHLTSAGGGIKTIANFFGTTSNIPLVSGGYYEIEIVCFFTMGATASVVTWTLTNSAAPTYMDLCFEMSPITGIVAPPGTATLLSGQIIGGTTAAQTVVTGSLTGSSKQYARFRIMLQNGTGTSLKIQATETTQTTALTPNIGSYWRCKRIPAGNVGTFAA